MDRFWYDPRFVRSHIAFMNLHWVNSCLTKLTEKSNKNLKQTFLVLKIMTHSIKEIDTHTCKQMKVIQGWKL